MKKFLEEWQNFQDQLLREQEDPQDWKPEEGASIDLDLDKIDKFGNGAEIARKTYEKDKIDAHGYLKILHQMANKLGRRLGKGSYRAVYQMKDKKVVKIVGTRFVHDDLEGDFFEEAFEQNEIEAGDIIDSKFHELLPEVEKGGEDYAWIIMEKIDVCEKKGSSKCIVDLFPNIDEDSFPDYFFDDPTPRKCVNAIRSVVKNYVSKNTLHPAEESVLEDSELLQKICKFTDKYGLVPHDLIRSGNIGSDSSGKLKLVDYSFKVEHLGEQK